MTQERVEHQPVQQENGQQYFSSSYFANQGREQEANLQELNVAEQQIQELSAKLGVDPETLTQQEEATQPVQEESEQAEDFLAKFNTEEGKRFAAQFKEYLGVDPLEAYNLINQTSTLVQQLDGWRREVQQERQVSQLRQEWGESYEPTMQKVLERFSRLPKEQQVALDNVEGARMLAALIRQEELSQGRGRDNPYVHTNTRPVHRGGNQSPVIRMSEMITWSDAELQARMPDIIRAKQLGTFINDY